MIASISCFHPLVGISYLDEDPEPPAWTDIQELPEPKVQEKPGPQNRCLRVCSDEVASTGKSRVEEPSNP